MKTLALFDFDGTLYKKDSLLEFTKFTKGKGSFYQGIFVLFPYLAGLKMGILSNQKVKEKFMRYFFRDMEWAHFNKLGNDFASTIDQDLNAKIFQNFRDHISQNDSVYIVTASLESWIQPWANRYGIAVIGTQAEILHGRMTGNFSSKNCFGSEKVNRIKAILNLDDFDEIQVYGSGKGDFEILQLKKKSLS